MIGLLISALFAATSPSSCTKPDDLVTQATVGRNVATNAPPAGIEPAVSDLFTWQTVDFSWPPNCRVRIASFRLFSMTTDRGVALSIGNGKLTAAAGVAPARMPELPHPNLPGARFVDSASLMHGPDRAGIWRLRDGTYLVAAYRSTASEPPRPILRSRIPLIGLSYIASPDSWGATMWLLQRVGPQAYRVITVEWGEKLLR